jgi:hypothetical protein
MANDLSGFLNVYAQESLPQLIANSPLFSSFTTDFSSAVASDGASVITRIPTATLALHDTATGFVAQSASSSAVTVTLKQKDITYDFTELEYTSDPNRIYNTFVPQMVTSFVDLVAQDVMSEVTVANFANYQSSSVAGYSGSAAFKSAQLLSTAKVPMAGRSLIVLPTVYESLAKDVSPAYNIGNNDTVQNYRIMKYAGFSVYEYANLPSNSETMIGFACHPSALAIATRLPQTPMNFAGSISNLTDPASGFSVQFREWYSPDNGKYKLAATLIYGYQTGNGSALRRIITG